MRTGLKYMTTMKSIESALIPKKIRLDLKEENSVQTCNHYVSRKKRFCKMVVAKGKNFCGEHEPVKGDGKTTNEDCRVVCPLDPKHTVYKRNLQKHLKICNSRMKDDYPTYIQLGVNNGSSDTEDSDVLLKNFSKSTKLSESSEDVLLLINKIEDIYKTYIDGKVEKQILKHDILSEELNETTYGKQTIKHLAQTASLLGYLEEFGLIKNDTCFVEFGAGKGQVSYWLAKLLASRDSLNKTNVILIDRASLRHKKDNKIEDRSNIHRIRADISDVVLEKIETLRDMKHIVAIGKHLCGSATDLMLRCLLHHKTDQNIFFIVSLCCHHKCTWQSFIGKDFLKFNGIGYQQFILMTKMVSWAVCGNGMSREKRQQLEVTKEDQNQVEGSNLGISKDKKKEIGQMCKRILDYARFSYLQGKNYECNLKFYVPEETTLENVCLIGTKQIQKTVK
ncbi:tRNA:m(4)X modification enzyme TRM13 homolog [Condylostylus longicornis]|uniref:tRNA:m(4)X modification enzyme TRM13 homolog n=1 Tax=Condylostylus longicornis TaxID=2530218 RepID=UPI00244E33B9|nr:tRNA:m(4)X modification enzyme TRM13 homolog [Condylostylus longicornis]